MAAPHTHSSLHVDQWQGNFWMAMVKGTKRWSLFHADDVPYLSPDYSRGTLDPSFPPMRDMDEAHAKHESSKDVEASPDTSNTTSKSPDAPPPPSLSRANINTTVPPSSSPCDEYPFLPFARRHDVDLGPGEVLFVPGGWPHVVHNLDVTVSFAGNFVDESNLDRALDDLKLLGAKYGSQMVDSFKAIDEVWGGSFIHSFIHSSLFRLIFFLKALPGEL